MNIETIKKSAKPYLTFFGIFFVGIVGFNMIPTSDAGNCEASLERKIAKAFAHVDHVASEAVSIEEVGNNGLYKVVMGINLKIEGLAPKYLEDTYACSVFTREDGVEVVESEGWKRSQG